MSLFYRVAYWIGVTPWEHAATYPPAAQHVAALFDREERERQPPYGRALDLGCGTGHWSVVLAQRGWRVTGVDLVAKALHTARQRAREAEVEVQFVRADVTALRDAGIGSDFELVWDFGTVHGLTPVQRQAVGQEINALASDDATVLMLAWEPGRRGPLPRGISREEVEATFAGWKITDQEPFDATGLPGPLRNVTPRMYRLRRAKS